MSSGSNSILTPKPLHSKHAPNGELKEKVRGSISPKLTSHIGHAFRCEYILSSFPSTKEATTVPSLTLSAV